MLIRSQLPNFEALFVSVTKTGGLSTKSPLTFFSASAGAAGTVQAKALTFIVPKLRDSGGIYSFFSIIFKVLMVSSCLLGMLLFCCRNLPKGSLSTNENTKKSEKSRDNNNELRI
jgi:hypothetical protein